MDLHTKNMILAAAALIIGILLHGILTAARVAYMALDKNRLLEEREAGDMRAAFILRLLENSDKFIMTLDFAEKLLLLALASYATIKIRPAITARLFHLGASDPFDLSIALIILVTAILLFIFGDLVPKRIVVEHKRQFAGFSVNLLRFIQTVLTPFVFICSKITVGLLRMFGVSPEIARGNVTMEELKTMIEIGYEQNIIDDLEKGMIESVIDMDKKDCEDIMTARTEVFVIDIDDPPEEYVPELIELRYSRIPVYRDHIDNIVGIIYAKDYLREAYRYGFDKVDLEKILKPAYFVPESKNVNDLFVELQQQRKHLAVLIDEYGGFSGIVTIEDLIEEITGDIDDEYDQDIPDIRAVGDNTFYAQGSLSIKELNSNTGTEFDEDSEDFDTLGGLLIHKLGYVPEDGEKKEVTIDGISFYIDRIWDKRIQRIRIRLPEEEQEEMEEEE